MEVRAYGSGHDVNISCTMSMSLSCIAINIASAYWSNFRYRANAVFNNVMFSGSGTYATQLNTNRQTSYDKLLLRKPAHFHRNDTSRRRVDSLSVLKASDDVETSALTN